MIDQRHHTPKTVTLRLSAVKAFLAYAAYEDLTLVALSQAAKALEAAVGPRRPVEYLTEAQTRAILAAFTGQTAKSPEAVETLHYDHRRTPPKAG